MREEFVDVLKQQSLSHGSVNKKHLVAAQKNEEMESFEAYEGKVISSTRQTVHAKHCESYCDEDHWN